MDEQTSDQTIPIKMYRSADRLMVAAPMPGLEPEDIAVEVTNGGMLLLRGELRGILKGMKDLLVDEWSVGGYFREVQLPLAVDGQGANLSYGNGVLVVALPLAEATRPAHLTLHATGPARGQRQGTAGHGEAFP